MPRLTNQSYLLQCHQVRDLVNYFYLLTATDQWALHMYFVPTRHLSKLELVEHRSDISATDPSLPQRAGRAFLKLKQVDERLRIYREQPKPPKKKGAAYEIQLMSEVHPVLDAARFARILQNYQRRVDK
jgi:hypothetical protein